ncbi:MAG: right-handed parallel beta-helix repeat-containing protein [Planctomycetota bacterium]
MGQQGLSTKVLRGASSSRSFQRADLEQLEERRLLATFLVTNAGDDGSGSLRDALAQANADAAADIIEFDPSLDGSTITLTRELFFVHDTTISGLGRPNLTISGDRATRVFSNGDGATVVIEGLSIMNGVAFGSGGGGAVLNSVGMMTLRDVSILQNSSDFGGGVRNRATMVIEDADIIVNNASRRGGGIDNESGSLTIRDSTISANEANGVSGIGGGIYNDAVLDLTNVDFFFNKAGFSGGGVYHNINSELTVSGGEITSNSAVFGGGGLYALSDAELDGVLVTDNEVTGADSIGGGILMSASRLTLSNSMVVDNKAIGMGTPRGGGVYLVGGGAQITESQFTGNTAFEGAGLYFGGGSGQSGVAIEDSRIAGNTASGVGGGLYANDASVTIRRTLVELNAAENGGGIAQRIDGSMLVFDSTIRSNTATVTGGGAFSRDDTFLSLTRSSISGNHASAGGGIWAGGQFDLSNSTVSGNTARLEGGGVRLVGANSTIRNSTVAENRSDSEDGGATNAIGGGLSVALGTLSVFSSIVAGNFRGTGAAPNEVSNTNINVFFSNSLIGDAQTSGGAEAGVNGNIVGADARLGPLSDNGGPTLTHALSDRSPAIDAGGPNGAFLESDQRGLPFVREHNGAMDIGAFEFHPEALVVDTAQDQTPGDYSPGDLSLAEAIALANAMPGLVEITFDAGLLDQAITPSSLPTITGEVSILGLGRDRLTISGVRLHNTGQSNVITDLSITGSDEGAVWNEGGLALNDVRIFDNSNRLDGGGVINSGILAIRRSVIDSNTTTERGGGVFNDGQLTIEASSITNNVGGRGGGGVASLNNAVIRQSEIAGNAANGRFNASGGGVFSDGGLTISGSTISGNTASLGGGLSLRGRDRVAGILASTIAFNTSTGLSGAGVPGVWIQEAQLTVVMTSSIVANNVSNTGLVSDIVGPNLNATSSFNLIGDADSAGGLVNGANGNLVGVDPMLAALADNGGGTRTHALAAGSPAINAGTPIALQGPFDQRGAPFVRTSGGGTDIGSFERLPDVLVVDTLADVVDSVYVDGEFSLREALAIANARPGADTIAFADSLAGTIALDAGATLEITGDVVINGPGVSTLVIDGLDAVGVFSNAAESTIRGVTITRGFSGLGSGVLNTGALLLESVVISQGGARSGFGGGVQNGASGTLTLMDSVVTGNTNGGVVNRGFMTILRSTIHDNEVAGDGGGVWSSGVLTLTNSTVSGNRAQGRGAGLFFVSLVVNATDPETMISGSTIAFNQAAAAGNATDGAGVFIERGRVRLTGSIVAGNTSGVSMAPSDILGVPGIGLPLEPGSSFNLVQDAGSAGGLMASVAGNLVGVDPMLAPLADNGGVTPTHALLAGSPAINAGDPSPTLTGDQRGVGRPRGPAADIGAFEVNLAPTLGGLTAPATGLRGLSIALTADNAQDPDGPLARVDFYLDSNNDNIADADELLGSDTDGSNGWSYTLTEAQSQALEIGAARFIAIAIDADGLVSEPASTTASIARALPTLASVGFSSLEFAQGDTVLLTAATSGDITAGQVLFYLDVNNNGVVDDGVDVLLGTDADGTDGFSYQITTSQSTVFSLGVVNVLASPSDGAGGAGEPVTQSANVLYSLRSQAPGAVRGVSDSVDNHRVVTINQAGDPLVFEQEGWNAINLAVTIGAPKAVGQAVTWLDPKDGLVYSAYASQSGLVLLSRTGDGTWSFRNLTTELGGNAAAFVGDVTQFISAAPTGRVIVIAGVSGDGRIVAYQQSATDASMFQFVDISASLTSGGFATPQLTELISYRPSWDAWHLAGIDTNGDIISVWQPPRRTDWRVDNLSDITGASPLAGGLSVILTSWNGITLTGVDAGGKVSSTWWVPSFGGDWQQVNLTDAFNGPTLENAALTSFYTPWNAQNYAGVNNSGEIVVYWWIPRFGGQWRTDVLTSAEGASTRINSALNAHVSSANTLNVFGAAEDGSVVRASWQPGAMWGLENLTNLAARTP